MLLQRSVIAFALSTSIQLLEHSAAHQLYLDLSLHSIEFGDKL